MVLKYFNTGYTTIDETLGVSVVVRSHVMCSSQKLDSLSASDFAVLRTTCENRVLVAIFIEYVIFY